MSEQEPLFTCPTPTCERVSKLGQRAIESLQAEIVELVNQHGDAPIDPESYQRVLDTHEDILKTVSALAGKCAIEKGPQNLKIAQSLIRFRN